MQSHEYLSIYLNERASYLEIKWDQLQLHNTKSLFRYINIYLQLYSTMVFCYGIPLLQLLLTTTDCYSEVLQPCSRSKVYISYIKPPNHITHYSVLSIAHYSLLILFPAVHKLRHRHKHTYIHRWTHSRYAAMRSKCTQTTTNRGDKSQNVVLSTKSILI